MVKGYEIEEYKTVAGPAEETIVIKKSRFIAYVAPARSEAEATEFIEAIKKKHWDATHNCSAYMVGEHDEIQKASDDGEPSGTAGRPILEVIKKEGLKNVVVVVTRYFGGIMLGAGGLIRAYGQSAAEGIRAAGVIRRVLHREIHATVDYSWVGKLENEFYARGYTIKDTLYTDKVTMVVMAVDKDKEKLTDLITDLTNGQATITIGELEYITFHG